MNPAAWSSLPASACTLGTAGANGPDRITRNIYDAAGQLLQVREGVGTSVEAAEATYSYTANGKRQIVVDGNGNTAQLVYDGFDRLAQWFFPSSARPTAFDDATPNSALSSAGAVNTADYEQYGYDANSNRTSLRKRDDSTLTYSYDALNRMLVKYVPERAGLATSATRDVYYDYDLRGLMLKARYDSLSGEGITSAYNGFGELTSSTISMGGVSRSLAHQYDLGGNRTRVTHPDGAFFTMGYDALGRMGSASWTIGGGTTPFMAINYENTGRRSNINRASSWTAYGYDPIGRLAWMPQIFAGGVYDLTQTFSYNPASQITGETRDNDAYAWTGAVAVNRNYTTNGLNQYSAAGPAAFTYDPNGNLTSDGSTSFTYDIENRLVSASGAKTASLVYDPMGRLFQTSGGTSGITRFLYDGDRLAAEYDELGTMKWRYFFGPGVDEPILADPGGQLACTNGTRFLHPNQQGSVIALADCWGARQAINSYDEYGIPASTNQGRFQYTGQAWIPELGMYYYKARIYSPTLGRFLQVDPIGYDDQINLYAYVGNDPVNATDPDGKWIWLVVRAAIKGAEACAKNATCRAIVTRGVQRARDAFRRGKDDNPTAQRPDQGAQTISRTGTSTASTASQRPDGVPKDFEPSPTAKGGGTKYTDPANPHNSVRDMPGNPKSPNPAQQSPYVRENVSGQPIDKAGRPVDGKSPDAHIPRDDYKYRGRITPDG